MILINRRLERPLNWEFFPLKITKFTALLSVLFVLISLGFTQKKTVQGYSGNYWIGTSGAHFTSFNDAIDSLEAFGMAGTVQLFVYGDTYNERAVINGDSITGLGTYSLHISNYQGDQVFVQDSASTSANNGVLVLNDAHNIFINGITWRALSSTNFTVDRYTGDCSRISFQGNSFYSQLTSSKNNADRVVMVAENSFGNNVDSLYISGNSFYNGSKSLQLNAASGNKSVGNFILGNEFIGLADLQDFDLRVHPNPAIDEIRVHLEGLYDGQIHLKLINLRGKEVLRNQFPAMEQNDLKVDVSGLAAGVYHVLIVTDQGTAVRKVFIR